MVTFDRLIRFSTLGFGLGFKGLLDVTVLNYFIYYRRNFVAANFMANSVLHGARCKNVLTIVRCNNFILLVHFEVIQ